MNLMYIVQAGFDLRRDGDVPRGEVGFQLRDRCRIENVRRDERSAGGTAQFSAVSIMLMPEPKAR